MRHGRAAGGRPRRGHSVPGHSVPGNLVAGVLFTGLALAACSSSTSPTGATVTTRAPFSATSTLGAGNAGSTSSTATTAGGATGTTSTTNPSAATGGGAIVITSPGADQTVVSPMQVAGRSRVGSVTVQLSDASGTVLASATVHPAGGTFSATIRFAAAQPGPGTLTAFDTGPGGARQDITQVPVKLSD